MIRHNTVIMNAQSDDSNNLYSNTLNVLRGREREKMSRTFVIVHFVFNEQNKIFLYMRFNKKTNFVNFIPAKFC